jgi:hypothetical protein
MLTDRYGQALSTGSVAARRRGPQPVPVAGLAALH